MAVIESPPDWVSPGGGFFQCLQHQGCNPRIAALPETMSGTAVLDRTSASVSPKTWKAGVQRSGNA